MHHSCSVSVPLGFGVKSTCVYCCVDIVLCCVAISVCPLQAWEALWSASTWLPADPQQGSRIDPRIFSRILDPSKEPSITVFTTSRRVKQESPCDLSRAWTLRFLSSLPSLFLCFPPLNNLAGTRRAFSKARRLEPWLLKEAHQRLDLRVRRETRRPSKGKDTTFLHNTAQWP